MKIRSVTINPKGSKQFMHFTVADSADVDKTLAQTIRNWGFVIVNKEEK